MSAQEFKPGDRVRCIETWTTHVIDSGDEFTVEDVDPTTRNGLEVFVQGEWVPARYFEKVEPEFAVGQQVSGDDYARLPVGSVVPGPNGPLIKVNDATWADERSHWPNGSLTSRRTLTRLGDGGYFESDRMPEWERELLAEVDAEDKDDLYVEPEPLKEGDWVHAWVQVESPEPDGDGNILAAIPRVNRFYGATRIRSDAIVRPGAGQVPPWVKPERCTSLFMIDKTTNLRQCKRWAHADSEHGDGRINWFDSDEYGRVEVSS